MLAKSSRGHHLLNKMHMPLYRRKRLYQNLFMVILHLIKFSLRLELEPTKLLRLQEKSGDLLKTFDGWW